MAATVFVSSAIGAADNTTTLQTSAFTAGGSNRVLYVLAGSGAGTPVDPSAVKWGGSGGTSLTKLGATLDMGSNAKASLWRLIAPATGSNTVHVTWGSAQDERWVIAVQVQDADQTTPNNTVATATGTNAAPTVSATSVAGDLVLDFVSFLDIGGQSFGLTDDVPDSLQELDNGTGIGPFEGAGASRETAAGTSTTCSWTAGGTLAGGGWSIFAFAVNAAAAGGGGGGSIEVPPSFERAGTRAPRLGRGPYSVGRYFRPRVDVLPTPAIRVVAAADETDAALGLSASKVAATGVALETDLSVGLAALKIAGTGVALESDGALSLSLLKYSSCGVGTETDTATALSLSSGLSVSAASEADTAVALSGTKLLSGGVATEVDAAFGLVAAHVAAAGVASESDSSQTAALTKLVSPGVALETDLAQAPGLTSGFAVTVASEADAAVSLAISKAVTIGAAAESDLAQAVGVASGLTCGISVETDESIASALSKVMACGAAVETDLARSMAFGGPFVIGASSEEDMAISPRFVVMPRSAALLNRITTTRSRPPNIQTRSRS
jgi:hypothetical protein